MMIGTTGQRSRRNHGGRRKAGASIEDVARRVGVSRATAARAFSNAHLVAEATREAVLEAAQAMDYRPNLMARGLAGGRTNTVGVLWSLGGTPVATGETRLVASELEKHDLMPYITEFNPDDPQSEDMLGEFARRGFDGVVIQISGGTRLEYPWLQKQIARFRAAVLVSNQPLGWDCDEVTRDRLGAYREVARHFARTGRRRPAIVAAHHSNRTKVEAFFDESERCRMEVLPHAVIDVQKGPQVDPAHVRHVLDTRFTGREFPFDAVMAGNDEIAILISAWLMEQGLRVPDDVALVGFDDMPISAFLFPPLASADRRHEETAVEIAALLTSRLEEPDLPTRLRELPMHFLWRTSAGGPPPDGGSGPVDTNEKETQT
ncbi:MAG: LacI family DNA-binding transcriptional regulator [Lentisphaerae bacterium]|nr:LacI family DNA-binding transcriptional regulator [Lentisphaerota bacterium]